MTEKEILEAAWERVSSGQIDQDPDSIYNNAKMFDYPRYTWDELERLIKGIK